jgi:hypothetical protein
MGNDKRLYRELDGGLMKYIIATLLAILMLVCVTTTQAAKPKTQKQKIRQTIYKHFHPLRQYRQALCIVEHESGFYPRAFNGYDYGLFQIEWIAHKYFNKKRLFEVGYNVAAAKRIYLDGHSWSPWSTHRSCGV